jgi:Ran GTPase-activating protein (RanGAP) involved in mRNA processing and transport
MIRQDCKRKYDPWWEQPGENASVEIECSALNDFVDAMKHNSNLESLTIVHSYIFGSVSDMKGTVSSAIADILRVNSTLTILNLKNTGVRVKGVVHIAKSLKVNASLTPLDLSSNSIQQGGTMALADALKVNSSLTSLNLSC